MERVQTIDDVPQRHLMRDGGAAITSVQFLYRLDTVKFAVMLLALQCVEQLVQQVVDEQQLQLCRRVVHRDGQVVCDVVAERRHRAVVVWAAPLARKVREAVDQHLCAGFLGISEEQLLSRLLGAPVLAVVAPHQRRLNRGRQHDRRFVVVLFQRLQQRGGKAKVALLEFGRVLGAIDAREVEHEIRLGAILIQLLRRRGDIILEDFVNTEIGTGAIFPVPNVFDVFDQVFADEALSSGDEDVHMSPYSQFFVKGA